MHVIPAIDIKGGRVVRHTDAGPDRVYASDPVAAAEAFVAQGARWFHVVDLDRAFFSGGNNDAVVRRIAALPGALVQMGGRLREPDQVARALELGAARAVVATGAAADPRAFQAILDAAEIACLGVAADVRRGRLVDRGSRDSPSLTPEALVRRAAAAGVRTVIHRDLDRDGELTGADVAGAARLSTLGVDLLAAGGIGSTAHLLAAREAGLAGVIVGRALHEGRFTLREALRACSA